MAVVDGSSMCRAVPSMRREVMPMTDLIDFVKLLTALVSLLTALIGLSEALKQRTKQDDMRKPFGSPPPRRSFFPRARDATMGFEYRPVR